MVLSELNEARMPIKFWKLDGKKKKKKEEWNVEDVLENMPTEKESFK